MGHKGLKEADDAAVGFTGMDELTVHRSASVRCRKPSDLQGHCFNTETDKPEPYLTLFYLKVSNFVRDLFVAN